MMRSAFLALAVAAAVVLGACGGGGGSSGPGESCPSNDLPTCPATPPSYAKDIAPILSTRCAPCHFAGGIEDSQHDYSTYDHVHTQRQAMLDQVYSCAMPPAGSPTPTADERAKLLAWFVCGAPNN